MKHLSTFQLLLWAGLFYLGPLTAQVPNNSFVFQSNINQPLPGCILEPPPYNIFVSGLPEDGTVQLQKVGVNISHPFATDIDIRLRAPNGVYVELSTDNGGEEGSHYEGTFFVFGNIIAENGFIDEGFAPFTGNYYPEGNRFANFGSNLEGTWQLEVCDDYSYEPNGTILNWSLIFGRTSGCNRNTRSIWCGETDNYTTVGGGNNFNTLQDYGNCGVPLPSTNNFNGEDVLYELFVPQSCNVTITLSNLSEDLDLILDDERCLFGQGEAARGAGSSIGCILQGNSNNTTEVISTFLTAGSYTLLVDGFSQGIQDSFTLSVTSDCPGCIPVVNCEESYCIEDSEDRPFGDVLHCDNFENYNLGAITPQSANWTLWPSQQAADAPVINNPFGPGKVLKVQRTSSTASDLLFGLGNQTSGRYRLSWRMYVQGGQSAYYNIQHQDSAGNWAYHVLFNANNSGELRIGDFNTGTAATFNYSNGAWNDIMQIIDLDENVAELWINSEFVYAWPFNIGDPNNLKQLGAINFFARADNIYYIDNICLWEVSCLDFTVVNAPVCVKNGTEYPGDFYARCDGYTSQEWEDCVLCSEPTCIEPPYDAPLGDITLCDNLEAYSPGNITAQSLKWELWPGTGTDALVAVNPSGAGQVLKVEEATENIPDVLLLLNNRSSGRYRLSWKMLSPAGKNAYHNIQYLESANSWAFEVFFGPAGTGTLRIDGNDRASFNYYKGFWNDIMQIIDLDQDVAELWINGRFVYSWAYSNSAGGGPVRLGAVNFFANDNNLYYIDDICLWEVDCSFSPGCNEDYEVCVKNGNYYSTACKARCDGYTSVEWENCSSVCDFGGTLITKGDNFTGTLDTFNVTPGLLSQTDCVLDAYDGNLPASLYGDIYTLYNPEEDNLGASTFQLGENTKAFVFICECDLPDEPCQQSCLGPLEEVFNDGDDILNPEGFYYILLLNETVVDYEFVIFPTGPCSNDEIVEVDCGDSISGRLTQGNDYGLSTVGYSSCYNGTRDYEGNDHVFRFVLDEPSFVSISLESEEPAGAFLNSFFCGGNCITYLETPPQGGEAFLDSIPLSEGVYYLIIDNSAPDGIADFTFTIDCLPNLKTSLFNIISDEGQLGCPTVSDSVHQVDILDPGNLSTHDRIHFLYTNENGELTTNDSISREWNGASLMPFHLAPDASGDSLKCSYSVGDTLVIFITKSENGHRYLRQMDPVYHPIDTPAVTAQDTFINNARSLILQLNPIADPVIFSAESTYLRPSSQEDTTFFSMETNLSWEISESPDAPWLSLSRNSGGGHKRIDVFLKENPFTTPRSVLLNIKSVTPGYEGYREQVLIEQLGVCISPSISIKADAPQICQGDTVTITAEIENASPGQYTFVWSNGETTPSLRVAPLQSTTYSVTVTERFCYATATSTATVIVEDTPPPPQSAGDVFICSNEPTLPLSVSVGAGQTADWYDGETGGLLLAEGTTSFVPPTAGTFYAEARTLSVAACVSNSRRPVLLDIAPAATAFAGDGQRICSGEMLFLQGEIGGSASVASWSASVLGGTFAPRPEALDAVYTPPPGFTGAITLVLSTDDPAGPCPLARDSLALIVNEPPEANAGNTLSTCLGNSVSLNGTIGGSATSATWSASIPGGSFSPDANTLQAMYQPPPGFTGDIELFLTTDDPDGPCPAARSSIILSVGAVLTIRSEEPDSVCFGEGATLTAVAEGGDGNYSYEWSDGLGNGATVVVPSLNASNTFIVTVTDGNGCRSEGSVRVVVDPAISLVTIPTSGTQVCPGSTINLAAAASGGAGELSYQWGQGLGEGETVETLVLTDTDYSLTVTDENGCTASRTVSISIFQPPVLAFAGPDQSICAGESATLEAIGGGGTGTFTYEWAQVPGGGQSIVVSPVETDTFQVIVTDSNGCIDTDEVIVNVTAASQAIAGESQTVCAGDTVKLAGVLQGPSTSSRWSASISGGIFIDGNTSLETRYLAPPGFTGDILFTLTADAFGACPAASGESRATFNALPSLEIDSVSCFIAEETYSLNVQTNAGSLLSDFGELSNLGDGSFLISHIPDGADVLIEAIDEQTSCRSELAVEHPDCSCPTISRPESEGSQTICSGEPFPALTVSVPEGQKVNWYDEPSGGELLAMDTQSFVPSAPGTYYAEAIDGETGCNSLARTPVAFIEKERPIAEAGADQEICSGDTTRLTALSEEFYRFAWSTGDTTASIQLALSATSFFVVTVTLDGCSAEDTVVVNVFPEVAGTVEVQEGIRCHGDSTGLLSLLIQGGTPPYTVQWSTGSNLSLLSGLPANEYSVLLTDSKGCVDFDTVQLVDPPVLVLLSAAIDSATNNQENGAIDITVEGGVPPYDFTWISDSDVVISTEEDPERLPPGLYQLLIEDMAGCKLDTVLIVDNIVGLTPSLDTKLVIGLYPNPTNGKAYLNLRLPEAAEVTSEIFDLLGRRVFITPTEQITEKQYELDLSDEPSGVYLAKIRIGQRVVTKKIIKQH